MITITENIENHILRELDKAEVSLDIAVAWITSRRIIGKIKEKKVQKLRIRILCWKEDEGQNRNRILKTALGKLIKDEFEIYDIERMHFKVCIIDKKVVIKGSYNWTESAKNNEEYIEICEYNQNTIALQKRFDKLREEAIRKIDNRRLKDNVIEYTQKEITRTFNSKIEEYIEEISERNRKIFTDIDERINEQKIYIESFEKRTKLYRNVLKFCLICFSLCLCTIVVLGKIAVNWYEKSILTRQEAKEELLKDFDAQNMKLYDIDKYLELEKNNQILQEWINKNPRDSRKFIEYRKNINK